MATGQLNPLLSHLLRSSENISAFIVSHQTFGTLSTFWLKPQPCLTHAISDGYGTQRGLLLMKLWTNQSQILGRVLSSRVTSWLCQGSGWQIYSEMLIFKTSVMLKGCWVRTLCLEQKVRLVLFAKEVLIIKVIIIFCQQASKGREYPQELPYDVRLWIKPSRTRQWLG